MSFEDTMAKVNPFQGGMLRNLFVKYQPFPAVIWIQNNTPRLVLPQKSYRQVQDGNAKRLDMVIQYFQRALAIQLHMYRHRFPALMHVLTTIGSLPLGMDLGDYRGCLDPSISYNASDPEYDVKAALESNIPLFTVSRSVDCPYAFPIPNYGDYQVMNMAADGWGQKHDEWNAQFPWESKLPKVYWRGGLKFSRYELLERVQSASKLSNITYLDVKQTGCPKDADPNFCTNNKEPPATSMKYKAVLDIDGNSWSDRFPRLLCYNSAVIKISLDEDYEEYFMADLEPNVHFIPASLENFTSVAAHYMNPAKDAFLRQIVQNANAFCKERFTEDRLNLDFLTILNSYVETLNQYTNTDLCRNDEDRKLSCWMKVWLATKASYIGPTAQDKHQGFTDLCKRADVPHLGSATANGTIDHTNGWDILFLHTMMFVLDEKQSIRCYLVVILPTTILDWVDGPKPPGSSRIKAKLVP